MSGNVQQAGVGMITMSLVSYCPAARSLFAIANWPVAAATRKHRTRPIPLGGIDGLS